MKLLSISMGEYTFDDGDFFVIRQQIDDFDIEYVAFLDDKRRKAVENSSLFETPDGSIVHLYSGGHRVYKTMDTIMSIGHDRRAIYKDEDMLKEYNLRLYHRRQNKFLLEDEEFYQINGRGRFVRKKKKDI